MKITEWADKITRFWRKDEADLATRIAQWDGKSAKDLPVIDPYDHSVKDYDTPKLQDTVPEKYRGLVHEAARLDDSLSLEGATSTDSVRILAIDQAGEALVYKRVESNEIDGMVGESIEHMSAAQAYEMIDNYRASHDLHFDKELDDDYMPPSSLDVKLAMMREAVGLGLVTEEDIALERQLAEESIPIEARPGDTYWGEIVFCDDDYTLQRSGLRHVLHTTASLVGRDLCIKGSKVEIRYPHGNIGLVASAEKVHSMTNERQFGIEQQSASMER